MDKQSNLKSQKFWMIPLFIIITSAIVVSSIAGDFFNILFTGLLSSLTPIIIGMFFVFILKHLIDFIENKILKNSFNSRKKAFAIKRAISLTLSFLLLFLIIFLIIKMIVPHVVEILTELMQNRERYIYQLKNQLTDFIDSFISGSSNSAINTVVDTAVAYLDDTLTNIVPKLLEVGTSTFLFIGKFALGLLLSFLYLKDKEKYNNYLSRLFRLKMKPEAINKYGNITKKADKILLDYLIGKLLEAIVITIGLGITMAILNVKYAFELALIISILNFIPYIGFIIGLVPCTLITIIYGSVEAAIYMLISVVVVFTLLTTFVTPFIIGQRIKTNILLMLTSMFIGGGMFGMIGMVLGPPVVSIISGILNDTLEENEKKITTQENNNSPEISTTNNSNNQPYDLFQMIEFAESKSRKLQEENSQNLDNNDTLINQYEIDDNKENKVENTTIINENLSNNEDDK